LGGEVTNDGNSEVTERGIVYGTSHNPTIDDTKIEMGSGLGVFNATVGSLNKGKTYYVRTYAINSIGTTYGGEVSFNTTVLTGTFTDSRDGRVYKWVEIGTQIWMAENLAYLPSVSPSSGSSYSDLYYYIYGYEGTSVTEAKVTTNYNTYGALYNWTAAMNRAASSSASPSGVQGVCPSDWHLPSDDEWKELEITLGMTQAQSNATNGRGTDQGKQMKAISGWKNNGNGTNSSGFSGLPGGYRTSSTGDFTSIGYYGEWWSATERVSDGSMTRFLGYDFNLVYRMYKWKTNGLSVRCIKN